MPRLDGPGMTAVGSCRAWERRRRRLERILTVALVAGFPFAAAAFEPVNASLCPKSCSGHGTCQQSAAIAPLCACDKGYGGADCSYIKHHVMTVLKCPEDCSGPTHGRCNNGTCVCRGGWTGTKCAVSACPQGCVHGLCRAGKCLCQSGFSGPDCASHTCNPACMNGGNCVDGVCKCDIYYTGPACETLRCPQDCSGKGQCRSGVCDCYFGWSGVDCSTFSDSGASLYRCDPYCTNNGTCDAATGLCICKLGFTGSGCEVVDVCPANCSFHGNCDGVTCVCDLGYSGVSCERRELGPPHHGAVVNGSIVCDAGWAPPLCTEQKCPLDCSNKGVCEAGKCACDTGYQGITCEEQIIPNGRIVRGVAQCAPGWMSSVPGPKNCDIRGCAAGCVHGKCVDGDCKCLPGWQGISCEILGCPDSCSGHGACAANGTCVCQPGWSGISCAHIECPANCHDRGYCLDGICHCLFGWFGQACDVRRCLNDCSGRGVCVNETDCSCDKGWIGDDCSMPAGFGHGDCLNGTCVCQGGWFGALCNSQCDFACNDHGHCSGDKDNFVCICYEGFSGDYCEDIDMCPNDCFGNGHCQVGICHCVGGWQGSACQMRPLPNGHGELIAQVDPVVSTATAAPSYHARVHCYPGWMGYHGISVAPDLLDDVLKGFCSQNDCTPSREFHSDSLNLKTAEGTYDSESIPEGCPRTDVYEEVRNDGPDATLGDPNTKKKVTHCPGDCMDHGFCSPSYRCECDSGYYGADCGTYYLPRGGHGKLVFYWTNDPESTTKTKMLNFTVQCDAKYLPPYCLEAPACSANCSYPHGTCVGGECICQPLWTGEDCSEAAPPRAGSELAWGCYCLPILDDIDSSERVELATVPTIGNGTNTTNEGRHNADVHTSCHWICPPPPHPFGPTSGGPGVKFGANTQGGGNGGPLAATTSDGDGFLPSPSPSPSQWGCPYDCHGHGECNDHVCNCYRGWFGFVCQLDRNFTIYTCPPPCKTVVQECYDKGSCIYDPNKQRLLTREQDYDDTTMNGMCECVPGYNVTTECEHSSCPYCNEHGNCMQSDVSACMCGKYWWGIYCEQVIPTQDIWYRSRHSSQIDPLWDHTMLTGKTNDMEKEAVFMVSGGGAHGLLVDTYKFTPAHGFELVGLISESNEFPANGNQLSLQDALRKTAPASRSGAATSFLNTHQGENGYIYLFGGAGWVNKPNPKEGDISRNPSYKPVVQESHYFNDLWKFDVRAEHWLTVDVATAAPPGRYRHTLTNMRDSNLVLFGGALFKTQYGKQSTYLRDTGEAQAAQPGWKFLDDIWTFNAYNKKWMQAEVKSILRPPPRCGHTTNLIPNSPSAYVFGGFNGVEYLNDLWIMELGNDLAIKFTPLRTCFSDGFKPTLMTITGDPESTEYKKLYKLPDREWENKKAGVPNDAAALTPEEDVPGDLLMQVTAAAMGDSPASRYLGKDYFADYDNASSDDNSIEAIQKQMAATGASDEQVEIAIAGGLHDLGKADAPLIFLLEVGVDDDPGMAGQKMSFADSVGRGDIHFGTPNTENFTLKDQHIRDVRNETIVLVEPLAYGGTCAPDFAPTWNDSNAPTPRAHHVSCVTGGGELLIGMGHANGSAAADFWLFNVRTQNWTRVEFNLADSAHGAPPARLLAAGACMRDKLWIYGGQDRSSYPLDDMWSLDLNPVDGYDSMTRPENENDIFTAAKVHPNAMLDEYYNGLVKEGKERNTKAPLQPSPSPSSEAPVSDTPGEEEGGGIDSAAPDLEFGIGITENNPSMSCADIAMAAKNEAKEDELVDGPYWIRLAGTDEVNQVTCLFSVVDQGFGDGWTSIFDDSGSTQVNQQVTDMGEEMPISEVLAYSVNPDDPPKLVQVARPPYLTTIRQIRLKPWLGMVQGFKPFGMKADDRMNDLLLTNKQDGLLGSQEVEGAETCGNVMIQTDYATTPDGLMTFGISNNGDFADAGACSYAVEALKPFLVNKLFARAGNTAGDFGTNYLRGIATFQDQITSGDGLGATIETPATSCLAIMSTLADIGGPTPPDGSYWIKSAGQNDTRLWPCIFGTTETTAKYGTGWTLAFDDSNLNQIVQQMKFVKMNPVAQVLAFTREGLEGNDGKVHAILNLPDLSEDVHNTSAMIQPKTLANILGRNWYGQEDFDPRYGGVTKYGDERGPSGAADHTDEQVHWRYKYVSEPSDEFGNELPKSGILMLHDSGDTQGGPSAVLDNIIGKSSCMEGLPSVGNDGGLNFECVKASVGKVPQTCYPMTPHGLLSYGGSDADNFVLGGCSYNANGEAKSKFVVQLWIRERDPTNPSGDSDER